ncbi:MAG: DUF1343 domain-containing protein [Oscillospiraceae bacterium]|nr:DUF1343 domain-containing protein [Oscillospiraceae bacterium]
MFGNGIDNLQAADQLLKGKRLGLVTNHTGVDMSLRSTSVILKEKYDLRFLVGPEHGVSGVAQAGQKVENNTDPKTGLPAISLFNGHDKALNTELPEVDMMVFDIQDVGLRFFTYIVTLYYTMVLCNRKNIPLLVLDRYNPLGLTKTEGTMLEPAFVSHITKFPLPTRHALTVGEYAGYINETYGIGCDLHICPCVGLTRQDDYYSLNIPWVLPTPNVPTMETVLCYTGTCHIEGTNLSTGRGTTKPYELIGAPWLRATEVCAAMNGMKLPGVYFREADFVPTFRDYAGEYCRGFQMHITDREAFQSFRTSMLLIDYIRRSHEEFQFRYRADIERYQMDILLGKDDLRRDDFDAETFFVKEKIAVDAFNAQVKEYHLY